MKTRFISLLLVLLLSVGGVFSLSSCRYMTGVSELVKNGTGRSVYDYVLETVEISEDQNADFDHVTTIDAGSVSRYSPVVLSSGYRSLNTDDQRRCYDEMDENVCFISKEHEGDTYETLQIELTDTTISEAQLRFVIIAFGADHPEVFWLDNKFGYSNSTGDTVLQLYSYMSADEITAANKELSESVKAAVGSISSGLSEYERELYVHDELLSICSYAEDVSSISDGFLCFTSYGSLVSGSAVCEGYTRGLQLLLSAVGIDSVNILGNGNDGLHMWSCVKLDGSWYYVDATWDDTSADSRYDYFNITTEQLLYNHTILELYSQLSEAQICGTEEQDAQSFNITVPVCSDSQLNYYVKNSVVVSGFGEDGIQNITDAVISCVQGGSDTVYLLVDKESLGFDTAMQELFYSGGYVFFDCIDRANESLFDVSIDRDSVTILKKPNLYVVCVYLQYK